MMLVKTAVKMASQDRLFWRLLREFKMRVYTIESHDDLCDSVVARYA